MPRSRSTVSKETATTNLVEQHAGILPELLVEIVHRKTGSVKKTVDLPDPRDSYCWHFNSFQQSMPNGGEYYARPAGE